MKFPTYDPDKYLRESISGQFGKGGFLSADKADDIFSSYEVNEDDIMMEVNSRLLDLADKGGNLGKTLNKLNDMRVNGREYHGKIAISLPIEVTRKPELVKIYNKIIKDVLNSFSKNKKESKMDVTKTKDVEGNEQWKIVYNGVKYSVNKTDKNWRVASMTGAPPMTVGLKFFSDPEELVLEYIKNKGN